MNILNINTHKCSVVSVWEKPFKLYLGCKKRETWGTLLLLIKKNQFIRNTQLKINSLNVQRKLQFKDSAFSWGQRVIDVWNFIKLLQNYLYDESICPDVKTIQWAVWAIRCVPVKVQLPVASWLETADLAWHSVQHSNSITTRDALDGCLSDLHLPVWCIGLLSRNRTQKNNNFDNYSNAYRHHSETHKACRTVELLK